MHFLKFLEFPYSQLTPFFGCSNFRINEYSNKPNIQISCTIRTARFFALAKTSSNMGLQKTCRPMCAGMQKTCWKRYRYELRRVMRASKGGTTIKGTVSTVRRKGKSECYRRNLHPPMILRYIIRLIPGSLVRHGESGPKPRNVFSTTTSSRSFFELNHRRLLANNPGNRSPMFTIYRARNCPDMSGDHVRTSRFGMCAEDLVQQPSGFRRPAEDFPQVRTDSEE